MNGRRKDRPSQHQLVLPLIEAAIEAGGRITCSDACDRLADRFGVDPSDRAETVEDVHGRKTNVWRRHVRFARQKAAAMGYVETTTRGVWQAADHAIDAMAKVRHGVSVTILHDASGAPCGARIDVDAAIPTTHTLLAGDARDLSGIESGQIPLVVTSVPYFDLKAYEPCRGQMSMAADYDEFLGMLVRVLREIHRVLTPGGRFACNVGDVLRSRRMHGSHHVLPLHADILCHGREVGFQVQNGILWRKIPNVASEGGGRGFLGRPGQPNATIASEIEHVLLLRKPGPYRSPTPAQKRDSAITRAQHARWFAPVWTDIPGARSGPDHPAPYPVELAERLVRMFSFTGDTVLDPFGGRFTTAVAAGRAGRNSFCVEIAPGYVRSGIDRVAADLGRA